MPDPAPRSAPAAGPSRLVLAMTRTALERRLVDTWLHETAPAELRTALVVDADPASLAARLVDDDDAVVQPVRVAWLPRQRDGRWPVQWGDAVSLTGALLSSERQQERIAADEPDRCRVVVGDPARVSDLRRRHAEEAGEGSAADSMALARFVLRAGTIALERAERLLTGDRYKVPRLVVEQIISTARFRSRLDEVATSLGVSAEEAGRRATAALNELVAVQSRLSIDVWSAAMRPLHGRAWQVQVDEASLDALRELNRRQALAFLPAHRSYADTLVLAEVLHRHDFPRNHVMGGNNLSFWPIGPLAKRAGIVFIRRSFGDDAVYKLAVEAYFGYLVAKRFNLEWYFEGGRTRTGKLRPPKYGLLRYVAAAVQAEQAGDVSLVPVSITYDHLPEVSAMAGEQAGAAKPKEGLGWLARYARGQRRAAGTATVRFGPPVSMRERLPEPGADEDTTRASLQKVAFDVAVGINAATPVTSTSLVTLALLGVRDRALTLDEVVQVLRPLLAYVQSRELTTEGLDLRREACVRAVLEQLTDVGVVTTYAAGERPVYGIDRGQHLVAAFYRNNSVHWFVNRAIVELAVMHAAAHGGGRPVDDAWQECKRLRDLLKFEFFFPDRDSFEAALTAEMRLIDPAWEERAKTREALGALLAGSGFLMAHRVLRSFCDAQLVVAERLALRDPVDVVERKAFLAECQAVGHQMQLQGRLHGPESVSQELFDGALRLAANRRLVDSGGDDLRVRREDFVAQLRDVTERVAAAQRIDEDVQREATRAAR